MTSPRPRSWLVLAATLSALLMTRPATPAEVTSTSSPTEPPARRHRLSFQLGAGAPLGILGVGWAFAPSEHLRVEGGAGLGYSSPQLSLMPQVAFGSAANRFVAGAGLALGVLDVHCQPACFWLNVDAAGYEHVFAGGFTFFLGAGVTMPFQDTGIQFFGPPVRAYSLLPQLKLGFGWWLGSG